MVALENKPKNVRGSRFDVSSWIILACSSFIVSNFNFLLTLEYQVSNLRENWIRLGKRDVKECDHVDRHLSGEMRWNGWMFMRWKVWRIAKSRRDGGIWKLLKKYDRSDHLLEVPFCGFFSNKFLHFKHHSRSDLSWKIFL